MPRQVRLITRWLFGEVCVVPGCRRARFTEHDHFRPVRLGGQAHLGTDRRLCGPCNRARHRGLLDYTPHPDGRVTVVDGRGRRAWSVRLGQAWVAPILAWAEHRADQTVLESPVLQQAITALVEQADRARDGAGTADREGPPPTGPPWAA